MQAKLENNLEKLWSLNEMEITGGEPDIVMLEEGDKIAFVDCSLETPIGRRNLCYDRDALNSRKSFKPNNSAIDVATEMGIDVLDEVQYLKLQEFGEFDLKTSSWIKTTPEVRKLGGALFADRRYNRVFIYHNGAESYYAARGFRGILVI